MQNDKEKETHRAKTKLNFDCFVTFFPWFFFLIFFSLFDCLFIFYELLLLYRCMCIPFILIKW